MKRLACLNLLGALALAVLCVAQWQRDRRLNLEINRLEKIHFEQAAGMTEQETIIRGTTADFAQFKEQFARAQTDLVEARQKLHAAERDTRQLAAERDQLKTSVTNWATAVTARDERLKDAGVQIRRLTDELNASIRKFNDLATSHNAVVQDLNDLRARLSKPGAALQPEQTRPQ